MHLRHCILFAFQMKKNASQATELIHSTLGDGSVSYSTVKRWFARLRDRNFSLEDDPRPGTKRKFVDEELEALLDENSAKLNRNWLIS